MKKLLLALVFLGIAGVANAGITDVEQAIGGFNYGTNWTVSFSQTPANKDVFVVKVTHVTGQGNVGAITVTDNVYNTNYTQIGSNVYDATRGVTVATFYFQAPYSSASVPTVSITAANGVYSYILMEHYTGFTGAAALDASIYQSVTQSTAGSALTFSGVTTHYANEVVGVAGQSDIYIPTVSGYNMSCNGSNCGTYYSHGGAQIAYYQIYATSGSTANFTGTFNSSSAYDAQLFGIYDTGSGGGGGGGATGATGYFNQVPICQWYSVSANTTLSATDPCVLVNASSGAVTITLPTAIGNFWEFAVKKTDTSVHTVTVATSASQTIDGSANLVLYNAGPTALLKSDNANWWSKTSTVGTQQFSGYVSTGSPFTVASGCGTVGSIAGGATAGQFGAGATSCVPVINLPYAPHGWMCIAWDITTTADKLIQTASSTTTCTLSGTVVSADTIVFQAIGY